MESSSLQSAHSQDDYWTAVLQHYYTDEELRSLDITVLIDGDGTEWDQLFAYQGFDHRKIYSLLKAKSAALATKNRTKKMGDVTYVAGNLLKDIYAMMTWFILTEKGRKKSTKDMSELMQFLLFSYSVDTNTRHARSYLRADTITLPRISACLPFVACNIMLAGKGKIIMARDIKTVPQGVHDLFLTNYLVPCFPALYTSADTKWMFFYVAYHIDEVMHRRARNPTPIAQLASYIMVAYKSQVMHEDSRRKYFEIKREHLLDPTGGKLPAAVLVFQANCAAWARNFLTDQDFAQVTSILEIPM